MIRSPASRVRRAGFTLIEVLVVIAIIGVLVSLTAAAIFKISGQGDILLARHDMSNLAAGVDTYKNWMKTDWLPSRFRLRENLDDYLVGIQNNDQLDIESYAYLKKLFPKIAGKPYSATVPRWVDWNNNGAVDAAVDLEGHQCLVFFLGGIQTFNPPTCTGFSTTPSDPSILGGERIPPFYNDFKAERLVVLNTPPVSYAVFPPPSGVTNLSPSVVNTRYFSYLDPWRQNVYGYFSSYKKNNGYNRYYAYYFNNPAVGVTSDCSFLAVEDPTTLGATVGLWPYVQKVGQAVPAPPEYLNPNTFQIICGGPDKVFGQGTRLVVSATGVWTTTGYTWSTQTTGSMPPKSRDDYSNFHDRALGSGD